MKKKHTVIALIMVFVMAIPMTAQAGFTPRYDVDMPEIPDIEVELSDATKDAIVKAVQQQIEKMESQAHPDDYLDYAYNPEKEDPGAQALAEVQELKEAIERGLTL